MLYYDEPQLELTLDAADGSYLKYPIPDLREVKPGVLATGQWTLNHPFVDAYLAALARLAPKQRPHQGPGASVPSTATTSPVSVCQPLPDVLATTPPMYPLQNEVEKLRWRAHHGGIASVYTVAQVITVQLELFPAPGSAWYAAQVARLPEEQKRAVFALAALKVLNHPTHPAHWALWAKNVLRRTAQVVEEVFQLKPCPIVSHVGWLGLPEGIWALEGLQSTFIPPPPPQPEKPKAGGMTLRKRKGPATTTSSSTAASSATPAEEEVALRVSPRKRQRTTRAQAALAQAQEEQEAAAAAAAAATAAVEAAEAEADTEVPASAAEESTSSMLLDVPPPRANSNSRDSSKAVKQELLDVDGASSALQPLGLALAVPDTAPAGAAHDISVSGSTQTTSSAVESIESASPRSRSAASLSPSATRRSTRARRKPAQGPVQLSGSSLSSVSTASTPLSALSTPETSPAPLDGRALDDPESADAKQQQQRTRAGSCGSSTAVSEAGEASEGTVVDADGDAAASHRKFGKRKAAEIEVENVDVDALVEHAQSAVAPPPSDIAATGPANITHATAAAAPAKSGNRRSRAKSGGGAARSKKRVKIDSSAAAAAAAVPEASGEENVPPAAAPAPSSRPAKKAKASAGSRARA
ncbi:hypothetical protein C8Q73DRAFT_745301 [Cubamyces lactineus]|nr:hypothetical protein C8Q73DRAFT_745301 [Cubamyces lactineus]